MQMPTLLNSQNLKIPSLSPNSPFSLPISNSLSIHSLPFFQKFTSLSRSVSFVSSYSFSRQQPPQEVEEEDYVIGDCVVFEEGVFEDPYLRDDFDEKKTSKKKSTKATIQQENLVPDKWKEAQVEINITKKERRKIAQQLEYGSRVVKRNKPVHFKETEGYLAYRSAKLSQLNPVVLDNPTFPIKDETEEEKNSAELGCSSSGRVAPRNPRLAVYRGTLDEITEFFNSGNYEPDEHSSKSSEGRRKLLTKEEKVLLNKRVPNLLDATSEKWLPLHTLAASGEFYLVDAILKHNVDINATDKDGLTALHKAIICKKQAVTNYLLRESANPFIRDKEGATLMHYAVQTASSQTIKILLLYNVDINLPDDDGWTPLHLAVQTRRTDLVRLLLIKGANKTLKNRDGLTPLELCLYYGRDVRTYELIKLLKLLPKSK